MIAQNDARGAILRLYPEWARANDYNPDAGFSGEPITGEDAMQFFRFVEARHPSALEFRSSGDKWQVVHSWLMAAGISN